MEPGVLLYCRDGWEHMRIQTTSMTVRLIALGLIVALIAATLPRALNSNAASVYHVAARTPTGLQDYERWFGSQHSHTDMDGDDGYTGATAATAFAYAKNLPHLQYFIITPHVHQARSGSETLYSDATYQTIRASASAATTSNFVAIAGQEISTISSGGHWGLFNANNLIGADHTDGDWNDADDYYDHVAGLGAAGEQIAAQFNHPQSGDFGARYDAGAAPYFGTVAVSSGPAFSTVANFSEDGSDSGYQTRWTELLNLGWKVSPAADQDNHENTWSAATSEYTVIVRPKGTALNANNVIGGLREHMTYATEDPNMQIGFVANGWSMGQTIGGDANVSFTIWWNNPSAVITNSNISVTVVETPTDAIQTIWIYKNGFTSAAAIYHPNTVSGTWNVSVPATIDDWFVVKFQDSYSLSPDRAATKDYTWSAPVWYDPSHADTPLQVGGALDNNVYLPLIAKPLPPTSTPTPTFTPTPTPTRTPVPLPPTNTPTPTPVPQSNLQITVLSGSSTPEYVTIQNFGSGVQNMTGWSLVSVVGPQTFYFPDGYVLAPGATVRLESYTGASNNPPAVLLWSTGAIWNNAGDKAVLYNNTGGAVSSKCYGNACP
jgi:hypothetical protein